MDPFVLDAQTWAKTQFATADLHDKRRTDRLVYLATQITAHPSGSFPEQTESWNDLRAAYNLFDCEDVTFEAIATPHWELTKRTTGRRLLIIADTTEIDYGPCRKVSGLSPVGSGYGQGFHLHSGLMVSAEDDRIHGLAGQLIHHRQPVPKGETRIQRLHRDDRESQIWCTLVNQIGSPPPGTSWVHVVDRGADDFEFFYHCQQAGTDWVARAKNLNRKIITPDGDKLELRSYLQTLPDAGSFTLNLRARPKQPARKAKLVVSYAALSMPTPAIKSPFLREANPGAIPILIGTIDAMSIYETPSGRLSSDAPLFRRPGKRKRPPASMNLPGGAQQRTAQTTGAKQSRARSLVVFQFLDVGLQFLPSGPAAEVELKHLQGPLGRLLACPKADQQAGDDSQVDLDLHAVLVGCQQMAAAQNALEPAKKEFY